MDFLELLSLYGGDIALVACMIICNIFGKKDKSLSAQAALEKSIAKKRKLIRKDEEKARKDELTAQRHLDELEELEKNKGV